MKRTSRPSVAEKRLLRSAHTRCSLLIGYAEHVYFMRVLAPGALHITVLLLTASLHEVVR